MVKFHNFQQTNLKNRMKIFLLFFKNKFQLFLVLLSILTGPGLSSQAFITTWKTDNPGTSGNNQITIPTTGSGYSYYVDWGDGIVEDWSGPYNSGNIYRLGHIWEEKSTYTIRAKAKDEFGAESAFGSFEVEIPRYTNTHNPIIEIFFQRFPNAFPILRQILGI